jgi:hypothetical protein
MLRALPEIDARLGIAHGRRRYSYTAAVGRSLEGLAKGWSHRLSSLSPEKVQSGKGTPVWRRYVHLTRSHPGTRRAIGP